MSVKKIYVTGMLRKAYWICHIKLRKRWLDRAPWSCGFIHLYKLGRSRVRISAPSPLLDNWKNRRTWTIENRNRKRKRKRAEKSSMTGMKIRPELITHHISSVRRKLRGSSPASSSRQKNRNRKNNMCLNTTITVKEGCKRDLN